MKPSLLIGENTHRDLSDLLIEKRRLIISGASNETAKSLLVSGILSFNPQPTILVTKDSNHTEALAHWLHFFGTEVQTLESVENDNGEIIPSELQKFLLFMKEGHSNTFLCSRDTWDQDFPLYSHLIEKVLTLTRKQEIHFTSIIETLIDLGYSHGEDLYLHPGEYRRTGDMFDIFPIQSEHPYRISLEFDAIESIISVDANDASVTTPHEGSLDIYPVVYEYTASLKDQLPVDHLLILDDEDDVEPALQTKFLRFTPFPESQENHAHLRYLSVLKFYTLTDFLNDIRDKLQQNWSLVIVTKRLDELKGIFEEEKIPHTIKAVQEHGRITLVGAQQNDLLPHSLQNPDLQSALLTDREIFSLKKTGKQRGVQKLALDFITSLVPGDFVVHMENGIGHFEGMTQKEVDDTPREYLELTYAEQDKLFVPVDQADKLSKFVHDEDKEPSLTRLGTQEWKKVTERMQKETQKIAAELLDLYAKRAKAKGYAYKADVTSFKKFSEAFPYQETPGQMKAIEDIVSDMEDEHPMDRLVCGDVGFGKTEVAMRAAFKAVQEGKQVAVVVPITILASQHYENFIKRMDGFNVRIELMSRLRSPKEQKVTLEKLRKGDADIVIGTHRLMQDDVKFLNLGLVIVDEEQRFGVKQKEKFKEMRANVDILTLTATPIPRTLNLGLHKLRDISTITTPPPGRLPIITEVRKYSDALMAQAISFELERSGQVYVLHNRVETIDAFADKLRDLVPKGKFIVGHGQLKPEELEKRILGFKKGEYNVLVSSTIIENGIDLPNANSLIVNAAECFGLSQLYQLRGRVGRSKTQAYAYFLYHGAKLKDDARKRLRAIVEACELGSGFQVAMRDLEIRGAGEILGASQSGTMHTVGVSHYLRMLKAAVEDMKAGRTGDVEEEINVEILLPVTAMLPSYYVPDEQERISVYQKLAGSEDEKILQEFKQDLLEEFGTLPEAVVNLFAILELKIACRRSGVQRIKMEEVNQKQEIVLTLHSSVTAQEIMQILSVSAQWRISGSTLKIFYDQLVTPKLKKSVDWVAELTKHVAALERKKKPKSKAKKEEE
jgi:transcription-repair coupling factor